MAERRRIAVCRRDMRNLRNLWLKGVGVLDTAVAVLLVVLTGQLPTASQVHHSFGQVRDAGAQALYAARSGETSLKELRQLPLASRVIDREWVEGMEAARQSLEQGYSDLEAYENQTLLILRILRWTMWLVATTALAHGLFLIMAKGLAVPRVDGREQRG
jgi:hypothetical protein